MLPQPPSIEGCNSSLIESYQNGPVKVRPNEIAFCKLKIENSGTVEWPQSTKLYQVAYSNYSAFKADQWQFIKVGACDVNSIKVLDVKILALKGHIGTFTFNFRLGINVENLFGETF